MAAQFFCNAVAAARVAARSLAAAGLCLALAACSGAGVGLPQLSGANPADATKVAQADGRSELQKATEYWGKEYAKNPNDAQTALNYARNLKALGEKKAALSVLQQVSLVHPAHRGVNSEYGRLALEFEQVSLAQKLLEQADDATNPDWRIVSARGTVLAKQGRYREAIAFYERALTLAPDQASVLNNLALAYAMEGNVDKAEPLLKRAAAAAGNEPRVSQNLALVLGLQGKYDEAKMSAAIGLAPDSAASNVDYMRSMVKLEPKAMKPSAVAQAPDQKAPKAQGAPELKGATADARSAETLSGWATQVAEAKKPAR